MNLKILTSVVLFFLSYALVGQINSVLQEKLETSFRDQVFKSSNISATVFDLESNTIVGGFRPKKVLVPASTLKLFTTYSGLKYLGDDFQFKTVVSHTGKINNEGTLVGDLIIEGGGDPTLGSDRITNNLGFDEIVNQICNQILNHGINCIEGNLVVDESVFDSQPVAPSWQWNDLGNYYASGSWGMNILENQYLVRFKARKKLGQQAVIHQIYPYVPGLQISSEVTIDSSHTGDNAYIFGGPLNYSKRILGTIPKGRGLFEIKGSLPHPSEFFLFHLRAKLIEYNIHVNLTLTVSQKDNRKKKNIYTIHSPNLKDIVYTANAESNNLYTESILKMIGLKLKGKGSGQNGISAIKSLLRTYNITTKSLHFHDGSGLSARNLISSFALARFLSSLTKEAPVEELINYLPQGGKDGTVKSMFANSEAKGNIWLKSGSMESVQSYAGYIKSRSGKWVSFSIIVNGFEGNGSVVRSKLDRIIRDIYYYC